MKMTDLFLEQLDKEATRTRRTLERVPEGRDDWKPHDKSMPLGRLAMLVAQMPSWIGMIVRQDQLDVRPPAGSSNIDQRPLRTSRELVEAHDQGVKDARAALAGVTDDQLMKPWRLLAGGKVMNEEPRYVVLRDTLMHLSHHRGQLTVYLRLTGQPVPAIYGPSADDQNFA
ncbi:MAG TPA: DinB family protein [Vicinamibacterales bacterium]